MIWLSLEFVQDDCWIINTSLSRSIDSTTFRCLNLSSSIWSLYLRASRWLSKYCSGFNIWPYRHSILFGDHLTSRYCLMCSFLFSFSARFLPTFLTRTAVDVPSCGSSSWSSFPCSSCSSSSCSSNSSLSRFSYICDMAAASAVGNRYMVRPDSVRMCYAPLHYLR